MPKTEIFFNSPFKDRLNISPLNLGYGIVRKESPKAFLIYFERYEDKWIPKSQIHASSEVLPSNTKRDGIIRVIYSFAEKAKWIDKAACLEFT